MQVKQTAFADSEYGTIREVLLCSPKLHIAGAAKQVFGDPSLAIAQHGHLVSALSSLGVTCRFIEPDPALPYQCYMRDSCVVTPWGLLVTRMGFRPRWGEQEAVQSYAADTGISVWNQVTTGSLEGGDIVVLRPGLVLIGVNGVRTTFDAAEQVVGWFEEGGWTARIVEYPVGFRHLDILFGVISANALLCCTEVLPPRETGWLVDQGYLLHEVPAAECLAMACNTLNLGNNRIMTHAGNAFGNRLLEALGVHTVPVDISEFAADDGGVHCLVQALVRDAIEVHAPV